MDSGLTWRAALPLLSILATSPLVAQQIWVGNGGSDRVPPKWATAPDFDGAFVFCRGFYTAGRRMQSGYGWETDYPGADINFSVRLAELTRTRVASSVRAAFRVGASLRFGPRAKFKKCVMCL